ncbi:hypothetical protein P168DRAFT_321594 [Aspergillus campestris IBT 28561]|uniref:Uncharacterized protein n=1 Tax=Aspergillus campestris (strain IBT 28561) TaxID=1392248 RepID=A0A2I1CU90_ASPC2|nr:uncharacterized protein P168DRAFT_321594 [Aspergillus campestris IBT 28561]PKY01177.1 hypothetical protein P168DRAFT_321594 [Aspergillus campestris IBT 28561]
MPKNTYNKHDHASWHLANVGTVAGATLPMPNPMGGIQNAQAAYSKRQYQDSYRSGMKQAVLNEDAANQRHREMQTDQVRASEMTYGKNGYTKENGYHLDKDGRMYYDGSKQ